MRRPFLRTSGSPQAPAIVETPAQYAPTLFLQVGSLSEVVIGSVEPTMSCTLCRMRLQNYTKFSELLPWTHKNRDGFVFFFLRMVKMESFR